MNTPKHRISPTSTSTRNGCKLCAPLGASLVFKGIEGTMTILHGSQGCSTYIRRYIIGHFREPIDIASSSFSEETTIFGGAENLHTAIRNIAEQYSPHLIGIATTCLAETIGEDVSLHIRKLLDEPQEMPLPPLVQVSTPSYKGTHMDGYHAAVRALAVHFAQPGPSLDHVTLFPNMLSPADLRHLKQIFQDFELPLLLVPDYSETLDGGSWSSYERIPRGGTRIRDLQKIGQSKSCIEFGTTVSDTHSAAHYLATACALPVYRMPIPIGIGNTDAFFKVCSSLSNTPIPSSYQKTRNRLIDAYVDGHKFLSGKSAALYGEEDLIVAMSSFLSEIGLGVSLCITGGSGNVLRHQLEKHAPSVAASALILEDADFEDLRNEAQHVPVDMMIGNSKGFALSNKLGIPLVRIGFPVHDRIGAQRILHVGYEGTMQLFDRIVNTLIMTKQERSPVGYLTW